MVIEQVKKEISATDMRRPLKLTSQEFTNNKWAYFKWLRENDPVHTGRVMGPVKAVMLAKYDDCVGMLKDPRFIRNRTVATGGGSRFPVPLPKSISLLMKSMIQEDGDEHRRLRNLVHKAFTPPRLQALEGRMYQITNELLDQAEKNGRMEMMEDFSRPIPVTVIAEMMGVDVQEVPELSKYIEAVTENMTGITIAKTIFWDMPQAIKFCKGLIDRKKQNPGDDILTGLIEAEDEGSRLSEDELIAMIFLIIIAGHETTYNLITQSVYTLLRHPDQLDLLKSQPELIDSAIEEINRYEGPLYTTKPEYPIEDVEYSGVVIPKGTMTMPMLGSANHDPAVFENPDMFDITRENNRHLGFGMGIHYCLGAPLARMETKIAIQTLFDRYPNLSLDCDPNELELAVRPGWHVWKQMPIKFN